MREIYTSKEAAADILEQRRNDPVLRERVSQYLGQRVPAACFSGNESVAFLARYVPRATDEDRLFADETREAGLVPYWASYMTDKYTTRNPEKVETIRPPIRWTKGQKTRQWIVDAENRSGNIGQLQTRFGYSSAEYQESLRSIVFDRDGNSDLADNTFDMTDWYRFQAPRFGYKDGNLAPYYYPAIMALATTYGALYEDFDGGPNAGNGDLARFMQTVVYPSIDKVSDELGVDPIIVRLPYQERMNETGLEFLDTETGECLRTIGSRAIASSIVEIR